MPRNQLKRFPTAILRRGMAHFHPLGPVAGPKSAVLSRPAVALATSAAAEPEHAEPEAAAIAG